MTSQQGAVSEREHVWFKCEQPCERPHCPYCDGGLAYCVVCKKGEAELEKTCPGTPDNRLDEVVERVAQIIDPDAFHEAVNPLPKDGLALHWMDRRHRARVKARAALASLKYGGGGE